MTTIKGQSTWRITLTAIALFGIALVLRLWHLTANDIAGDEPFSILVAQQSVGDIIRFLNTGNNPPLFELLLHHWMLLVGQDPWALRLLPALCSALTVIPLYLIGVRFFHLRVALLSTCLFILSWQHTLFAHEVRIYTMFSLFTAIGLLAFLSAMQRPERKRNWVLLVLSNVVLLYGHYMAVFVLAAQAVVGIALLEKKNWKHLLLTLVASVMLFTPGLWVFFSRFGAVADNGTWVQAPQWSQLYGSVNLMLNDRLVTVAILVSMMVAIFVSLRTSALKDLMAATMAHRAGKAVVLWFVVAYGGIFIVSMAVLPLFIDRYILFASVPLYLAVGWAVDMVWRQSAFAWAGAAVVVLTSLTTADLDPSNHRALKAAVLAATEVRTDADVFLIAPASAAVGFAYHAYPEVFQSVRNEDPVAALQAKLRERGTISINSISDLPTLDAQRVVLFDADVQFSHPDNGIRHRLASEYLTMDSLHFPLIFNVYTYTR